jgi:hypothetical protein
MLALKSVKVLSMFVRPLIVKALFSRHEVFSGTAAVSVTDTTV